MSTETASVYAAMALSASTLRTSSIELKVEIIDRLIEVSGNKDGFVQEGVAYAFDNIALNFSKFSPEAKVEIIDHLVKALGDGNNKVAPVLVKLAKENISPELKAKIDQALKK